MAVPTQGKTLTLFVPVFRLFGMLASVCPWPVLYDPAHNRIAQSQGTSRHPGYFWAKMAQVVGEVEVVGCQPRVRSCLASLFISSLARWRNHHTWRAWFTDVGMQLVPLIRARICRGGGFSPKILR